MKHSEGNIMVDEPIWGVTKCFIRFAVAIGGFLIFLGIIVIGVFIMDFFGIVEFRIIESESLQSLLLLLLAIGLADLVAGIMLWRR
jgi:hypothetical protein